MSDEKDQDIEDQIPSTEALREWVVAHAQGKSYLGRWANPAELTDAERLPDDAAFREYATMVDAYFWIYILRGDMPWRVLIPVGLMLGARIVHMHKPIVETLASAEEDDLEEIQGMMRVVLTQAKQARKLRAIRKKPQLEIVRQIPPNLRKPGQ